jgi:hypothetical protein
VLNLDELATIVMELRAPLVFTGSPSALREVEPRSPSSRETIFQRFVNKLRGAVTHPPPK